jgi:hypothetical protein
MIPGLPLVRIRHHGHPHVSRRSGRRRRGSRRAATGVRNCDAVWGAPLGLRIGLVSAGRVARIVTGRPMQAGWLLSWRWCVEAGAGSARGPFVTGRRGRAVRSKCPRAAGTGLVTIAAGLIRSLSDPWVVTPHRPAARCLHPGRRRPRPPPRRGGQPQVPMLEGRIEQVIGSTPTATATPPPCWIPPADSSPRSRPQPARPAMNSCWACRGAGAGAALLGAGGNWLLRRRAGQLPGRSWRVGRRDRSAQADRPHPGQERRPGRDPSWTGSAQPRPAGLPSPAGQREALGCCSSPAPAPSR